MSNDIIPLPPDKQNTPGILYRNTNTYFFFECTEDVQNMYRRCTILFRILIGVPDYSSIFMVFFQKMKRELTPLGGKNI